MQFKLKLNMITKDICKTKYILSLEIWVMDIGYSGQGLRDNLIQQVVSPANCSL